MRDYAEMADRSEMCATWWDARGFHARGAANRAFAEFYRLPWWKRVLQWRRIPAMKRELIRTIKLGPTQTITIGG